MKVGTRSLLFGVHQVFWHPITVLIAWWRLYGRPSWRELVCIIIHDWGYWGKPDMDGDLGERHPEWAANVAGRLFGPAYQDLCLFHSRHYARRFGGEPSKLCWADKLSILYEPWWLYLPRAWLSGELFEYRQTADRAGVVALSAPHREWFACIQERLATLAREKRGDAVSYVNTVKEASTRWAPRQEL